MDNNIYPENNFFHNIQIHFEYYTDEQFNVKVKMDKAVSIIHFNSRSLNSNFSKIKQCLQHIEQKMTVIAISKTWLNDTTTTGAELWKICCLLKIMLWSVLL